MRLVALFTVALMGAVTLSVAAAGHVQRPIRPPSLAQVRSLCEKTIAQAPGSDQAAAAVGRMAGLLLEAKDATPAVAWLSAKVQRYTVQGAGLAAQYWLGVAFERQGDAPRAEQAYRALVDTRPEADCSASAVTNLARLLAKTQPDRAAATLAQTITKHPNSLAAWQAEYEQGALLLAAGKVPEADEAFSRLIAGIAPDTIKAQARVTRSAVSYRLMTIASSAYYAKDYPLALQCLGRVLDDKAVQYEWPWVLLTMGKAHQDLLEYDQAVAAYRRLVAEFPKSSEAPDGQFRLAECLQGQRKWDEAVTEYRRIKQLWPDNGLVLHADNRIEACQQEREAAALAARRAPEATPAPAPDSGR